MKKCEAPLFNDPSIISNQYLALFLTEKIVAGVWKTGAFTITN